MPPLKSTVRILVVAILCFTGMVRYAVAQNIFINGTTQYDVVVSAESSASERKAAQELCSYLQQVSGAHFDVARRTVRLRHIFVGYDSRSDAFATKSRYADYDDSFEYEFDGQDVFIWGGRQRGTMYGVFAFLEREVGVRWLTSDCTHVPHLNSLKLHNGLHVKESPAIAYRFDYSRGAMDDDVWCAHNKLNMQIRVVENDYGGLTSYWGAHTFQKLLPPQEYFKQHPEYFSLRDGRRVDNGQLCLSNPDVLRLTTERLLRYIKANPNCWGYDVSQNDNMLYCECRTCQRLSRRYGGESGLMLWFVNQVAERIEREYPTKLIGTFAYEYTRRPPRGIRPASNVVIRLCDIECCFVHPLDECSRNRSFMDDLKAWQKITDKIFVWDYIVNFHHYHLPFPNFQHLGRNIDVFSKNGVMGILELGSYDAQWSEFSELKQWLIAKLLWNPSQDVDTLARQFIDNYYSVAAEDIWHYYRLVNNLNNSSRHSDCHAEPDAELYNAAFRQEALRILRTAEVKAAANASDTAALRRVRRVLAQAYVTHALLDKKAAATDGTLIRLKQIIDADPTTMRERGQNFNQWMRAQGYI